MEEWRRREEAKAVIIPGLIIAYGINSLATSLAQSTFLSLCPLSGFLDARRGGLDGRIWECKGRNMGIEEAYAQRRTHMEIGSRKKQDD